MYTLRVAPSALSGGGFHIRLELVEGDIVLEREEVAMAPLLTPQDLEDLRWYLEDFPAFPLEPATNVADLIERRSNEAGVELFRALFEGTPGVRRIWSISGRALGQTRIEIGLNSPSVDSFPWELLREKQDSPPLAVLAQAFVRRSAGSGDEFGQSVAETSRATTRQPNELGLADTGPEKRLQSAGAIRVLVVICRPDAQFDLPFRSVAGHLLSEPSIAGKLDFQVLRPPSFDHLRNVLAQASAAHKPFHIVHFDGHGIYEDLHAGPDPATVRERRGYLVFEDPSTDDNRELVHGAKLGRELSRNGVQILVMNACRSAHAGVVASPAVSEAAASGSVRAYGSLASESIRSGLPAVIAMRYNVWVDNAARFMREMYSALAESGSLGESVQRARTSLFFDNFHGQARRRLEGWQVPVLYEQMPIRIVPEEGAARNSPRPDRSELVAAAPPAPQIGFSGHDAVILAIERMFDSEQVVVLIGPAGAGKTALLGEFSRWMVVSGGSTTPILYTSLRDSRSIADVIDSAISSIGGRAVGWSSLGSAAKYSHLLAYLRDVPSLWLWDDVDLATGAVMGRGGSWPSEMQSELRKLLGEVSATRAKLLLASRANTIGIEGLNSGRVLMPPLARSDQYEILRRVAMHYGKPITDLEAWELLIEVSGGNKLALVALAECALNAEAESRESIHSLLDRLFDGTVAFQGPLSAASVRAIDVELAAALERFAPAEQKQLALLALFRNLFTETTVRYLGRSDCAWGLQEVGDISAMDLVSLLSRFAETGLLEALPGGYFVPHPLLPILLRPRLDQLYAPDLQRPLRAFVDVISTMCTYMVRQYNRGEIVWSEALEDERANLFYAFHVALKNQWWDVIVALMQGVRLSFKGKSIRSEWPALVDRIVPLFNLPRSEGPIPGREEDWILVMDYRIGVAMARTEFAEAERLEQARIHWLRRLSVEARTACDEHKAIYREQMLARSLRDYAGMLAERNDAACLPAYLEAFELMMALQMRYHAGLCARDLAVAYGSAECYADPERSEAWIRRTIELIPGDKETMSVMSALRAKLTSRRAKLTRAFKKFSAGERAAPSGGDQSAMDALIEEIMGLKNIMANEMQLPSHSEPRLRMQALWSRAVLRLRKGDERGLTDFLEALQIASELNDIVSSAEIGLNLADLLLNAGRRDHAANYARTALKQFIGFGERGTAGAVKARELLARIDKEPDSKG